MNLNKQLTSAFLISLLCAVGFGCMALFVSDRAIASWDMTVISLIQGWESPFLTKIMEVFTAIGGGIPLMIISFLTTIFLYFVFGHFKELILFLWVVLGTFFLNEALKLVFRRTRPTIHRMIEVNGFSFPSGHSMLAFSLYGVLVFLFWRHIRKPAGRIGFIVVCSFMIIMIGVSRIYLGVHYPSDVIGGFLASGSWLAVSIWFYQRYQEKRVKSVRSSF